MAIRGIKLENVQISARTGIVCVDAEQISLTNVSITPATGPVITVRNSRDIMIDKASSPAGADLFLKVEGEKTSGIKLSATDWSKAKKAVEFGKGASESAVIRR